MAIEQGKVARSVLQLKAAPNAQTSFGFSGRFCLVRWPLFQGTFLGRSDVFDHLVGAGKIHPDHQAGPVKRGR